MALFQLTKSIFSMAITNEHTSIVIIFKTHTHSVLQNNKFITAEPPFKNYMCPPFTTGPFLIFSIIIFIFIIPRDSGCEALLMEF